MLTTLIDTWLTPRRASGFALSKYERHLRAQAGQRPGSAREEQLGVAHEERLDRVRPEGLDVGGHASDRSAVVKPGPCRRHAGSRCGAMRRGGPPSAGPGRTR